MADLSGVWRYDSSEVIAAPAPGYLRSGPAPVTQLAVASQSSGGADAHTDLLRLNSGATMLMQEVSDATLAAKFQLTASAVDHTTWVEYLVVVVTTTSVGAPRKNQDLLVNGVVAATHGPYTTIAELQRVLQKPAPTAAEQTAMQRTIDNAAREIDWDLAYNPADNPSPSPGSADYPVLAEVNLARAVELWNIEFRPFGQLPAGPDAFPILAARDSWYRHHLRLNPLRTRYPVG